VLKDQDGTVVEGHRELLARPEPLRRGGRDPGLRRKLEKLGTRK